MVFLQFPDRLVPLVIADRPYHANFLKQMNSLRVQAPGLPASMDFALGLDPASQCQSGWRHITFRHFQMACCLIPLSGSSIVDFPCGIQIVLQSEEKFPAILCLVYNPESVFKTTVFPIDGWK